MSKKRAEIRRTHRAAWMRWIHIGPDDRRMVAPPCDWPGDTRQERRAVWRNAWRYWLPETIAWEREREQRAREEEEERELAA